MTVSKAGSMRAEKMLAMLAATALAAVAAAILASMQLLSPCPGRAAAHLVGIGAGASFEALAAATRL